jgi:hypothetical protein
MPPDMLSLVVEITSIFSPVAAVFAHRRASADADAVARRRGHPGEVPLAR